MWKSQIVGRLNKIIEDQSGYHSFDKYTKPKLEKLIEDIRLGEKE